MRTIVRRRWMRLLTTGGMALLLLLAAACGGDSDDGNGDPTAGPTGTSTGASPTGTAGASGTPEGTEEPSGGGGDGSGALADLADQFANASFMVTFQMESTSMGESMSGTWTWYMDTAGNRTRFDISDVDPSMPGTMTVITTPDESIICFEGTCLGGGIPGLEDPSGELFDQVDSVDDLAMDGTVRDAGTRTIAGVQARCFEFDNPEESIETGILCFSPEGVPLFSEWSSATEGSFRMEALAYSNSVSDADFEPPFPIMALPTGN